MSSLGAHLTPNLTCLHLAIPGFDRLLLTHSHISWLHLISYPPFLKSLLWEDEREHKMIEVTGPVVHWRTVSENAAKSYFQLGREHPFALCNSWVDHKKVKIANVSGTLPLTHSNGLIYRYKNHYFFLFPEAQLSCWGNFLGSQTYKAKPSRWLHSNLPSWNNTTVHAISMTPSHSIPPALSQNRFGQVPKEWFEIQTLLLICMQSDIWMFLKPIFCAHWILPWWKYTED